MLYKKCYEFYYDNNYGVIFGVDIKKDSLYNYWLNPLQNYERIYMFLN